MAGEREMYADLIPTLGGKAVVSDRYSAQGKAYQNRYYRKYNKAK